MFNYLFGLREFLTDNSLM